MKIHEEVEMTDRARMIAEQIIKLGDQEFFEINAWIAEHASERRVKIATQKKRDHLRMLLGMAGTEERVVVVTGGYKYSAHVGRICGKHNKNRKKYVSISFDDKQALREEDRDACCIRYYHMHIEPATEANVRKATRSKHLNEAFTAMLQQ